MIKKCLILEKNNWPPMLLETPYPPKKLWYLGEIPDYANQKLLAIVGSRKYSSYGKQACEHIIEGLCGYPITIVSGLALGIDSIAHRKALECGLKCIAVPGSGLAPTSLYPPKNHRLADEILENNGCLISEFEPDENAHTYMFPQRNRIMAGMCHAVLIIEAEEKSGTLITARLAADYNREVLAIPHEIFSKNGQGANELLRQGAHLIHNPQDVLQILGFDISEHKQKSFDFKNFNEYEIKIIQCLSTPQTKNDLISKLDFSIEIINQTISILEIKGIIIEEKNLIRLK